MQEAQRLEDAAKEAERTHQARLAELVALEARLIQPSAPRGGAAAASPLDPPGAVPGDCGGLVGGAQADNLDPALLAMVMDEQKPLRLQASGRNESQDEVCTMCPLMIHQGFADMLFAVDTEAMRIGHVSTIECDTGVRTERRCWAYMCYSLSSRSAASRRLCCGCGSRTGAR